MLEKLQRRLMDHDVRASLMEYALIIGLIVVVAITVTGFVHRDTRGTVSATASGIR
jgi:Flp pilus assembly pilin Flp